MKDILLILVGVLLSIPVGFLINLTTPKVRELMSRTSLRVRERQARRLRRDERLMDAAASNPDIAHEVIAYYRMRQLSRTVMYFASGIFGALLLLSDEILRKLPGDDADRAPRWVIFGMVVLTLGYAASILLTNDRRYRKFSDGISRRTGWPHPDGSIWSSEQNRWVDLADQSAEHQD